MVAGGSESLGDGCHKALRGMVRTSRFTPSATGGPGQNLGGVASVSGRSFARPSSQWPGAPGGTIAQ